MIFISYQYTARHGEQFFNGFGNGFLDMEEPTPKDDLAEWLEEANEKASEMSKKTNGFDSVSAVVMSYKWVNK